MSFTNSRLFRELDANFTRLAVEAIEESRRSKSYERKKELLGKSRAMRQASQIAKRIVRESGLHERLLIFPNWGELPSGVVKWYVDGDTRMPPEILRLEYKKYEGRFYPYIKGSSGRVYYCLEYKWPAEKVEYDYPVECFLTTSRGSSVEGVIIVEEKS